MSQIENLVIEKRASVFPSEMNVAYKIMGASLAMGLISWLPLVAFIAFGAENGNPVRLGLLAMVATPVATIGFGFGVVRLLVDVMAARKA